MKKYIIDFLTLFSSFSTLFCCALPALFVTLGMGASFAGLIGQVPQLVWFSENKEIVFGFSSLMLTSAGWLQWKSRRAPCPTDPKLARSCSSTKKWSLAIYCASIAIYFVGAFFAFFAHH